MPVQVQCPHCASLCLVGEQHFGSMVSCGRCGQAFTVRSAPAPAAPAAAPTSGQANIKDTLRGVFKSLMPFSKVEGMGLPAGAAAPASAAAASTATKPADADDDVGIDFGPGVEARLEAAPPPAPPAVPRSAAETGRSWKPIRPAGTLRLDIGGATSTGMVRKRNEDSFLLQHLAWSSLDNRQEMALIVVADGMGGHEAGDKASQLAIQQIGSGLAPHLSNALTGQAKLSVTGLATAIEQAIKAANQAIYRRAQTDSGCRGMGTTGAVVLIWEGQAVIGHVGDCRVYGVRGGKVNQLTKDQTLVEKMVRLGQLRPDEAANHPARNEVAQAIGRQPDVEPAICQIKLLPADWLLVACDGLHAHVDTALLEKTIRDAVPSGTGLAHELVDLANTRGGSDNCTVVAVRCY